jgi:hypothetical protein
MRKAVTAAVFVMVACLALSAVALASSVRGTNGKDRLSGTGGADSINAKAGNDRVRARGGRDRAATGWRPGPGATACTAVAAPTTWPATPART